MVYRSPGLPDELVPPLRGIVAPETTEPQLVRVRGIVWAGVARIELLEGDSVKAIFVGDGAELDETEIERATMAVTVALLRDQATCEREDRISDGLFECLVAGPEVSDATIAHRAASSGIEFTGPHCVVGVLIADVAIHTLRHRIRRLAAIGETPAVAVVEHDGAALALVDARSREACRCFAATLARELPRSEAVVRPRIAYAGPREGVAGARQATAECLQTLRALRLIGRSESPATYDELGIWTILGSADSDCLARFRDSMLGPLFEHDQRPASQLISTLRALVRADFEWRPAAAQLGVHPNTVRYRMSVIAKLTGLDLGSYGDQVKADIALRAADMLTTS